MFFGWFVVTFILFFPPNVTFGNANLISFYQNCPFCSETNTHDNVSSYDPSFVIVDILKQTSVIQIINLLYEKKIIQNKVIFLFHLLRLNAWKRLKAGQYRFSKNMDSDKVLEMLIKGWGIRHKITIPEGETVYKIVQSIEKNPCLSGKITHFPVEGALLPGTYFFSYHRPRQALIEEIENRMGQFLDHLMRERDPVKVPLNKKELLILASIVEKETGQRKEKFQIAGVFLNRMRKKMPLQADPTIIYGITFGKKVLKRSLTKQDLKKDSAYNTYTRVGLPPTPICCPSEETLLATISPTQTRFLFFVADGSGGHVFSSDLKTHRNHVLKQKNGKKGAFF